MSTFKVERRVMTMVPKYHNEVLLETDDGIEAEAFRIDWERQHRREHDDLRIVGTDPTHDFEDGRCVTCGVPDNGCYGSHLPCGFNLAGRSLVGVIADHDATSQSAVHVTDDDSPDRALGPKSSH